MLFYIEYDTMCFTNLGVAQLVACYLGVVEVVGSSPVTQTRKTSRPLWSWCFSILRGLEAKVGTRREENDSVNHF